MAGIHTPSSKFSYSRLETYIGCNWRYYLTYEKKLSVYSENIALKIGLLIHETEEFIAKSIMAGKSIDYIALKNDIICKLFETQAKYPKAYAELDKAGRTYFQKMIKYLKSGIYHLEEYMNAHPELEILGVEQDFDFSFDDKGHVFRGQIDRIFKYKNENRYIIQDIKTYYAPVEDKKLEVPLQFVIYSLAIQDKYKCTPDQITCQYYLPFCDKTQQAKEGYLEKGIVEITKEFENITNKQWTPNPTALCGWCPYSITNPDAKEPYKYCCPYYAKAVLTKNGKKAYIPENKWEGLDKHITTLKLACLQNGIKLDLLPKGVLEDDN